MVAGRLQEKNGFYYIVLSYTDSAGKMCIRDRRWKATLRRNIGFSVTVSARALMICCLPRKPGSPHC